MAQNFKECGIDAKRCLLRRMSENNSALLDKKIQKALTHCNRRLGKALFSSVLTSGKLLFMGALRPKHTVNIDPLHRKARDGSPPDDRAEIEIGTNSNPAGR